MINRINYWTASLNLIAAFISYLLDEHNLTSIYRYRDAYIKWHAAKNLLK